MHAVAPGARVAFDQHRNVAARHLPGRAQAFDNLLAVGHDGDVDALRQCGEAFKFMSPHNIEGQQHVGDAGIGHHFGLAEFLHGDAARAQLNLRLGKGHQLMGLDMRPVGNAQLVAARLPFLEVVLDDADVDQRHRRFKVLDAASHIFKSEVVENVHGVTPD